MPPSLPPEAPPPLPPQAPAPAPPVESAASAAAEALEAAPEAEAAASASTGSMLIIGLIIGLVVGFLLGFLLGTRAKQLAQSLLMMPSALKTLLKSLAPWKSDFQKEDEGEADDTVEGDEELDAELNVDNFLNNEQLPGLDDHPEVNFNPIILYKVKQSQEEVRKEKRRAQLIADGFDPDAMDEYELANAITSAPQTKANPLNLLIELGARVTAVRGGRNQEAIEREDRRRQLKTIDTFLSKHLDADVTRVTAKSKDSAAAGGDKKKMSALDVAKHPVAENARDVQYKTSFGAAKWGREQLREIQRVNPPPLPELEGEDQVKEDGEDLEKLREIDGQEDEESDSEEESEEGDNLVA